MADLEMEIKRVNFFDGQYLQAKEFIDLTNYIVHMRRRLLYSLFTGSGVVQIDSHDLQIVTPNMPGDPTNKIVMVTKGMAIGRRADTFESNEIILREDT